MTTYEIPAPPPPARSSGPGFWWRVLSPIGAVLAALVVAIAVVGILVVATPLADDEAGAVGSFVGSLAIVGFGLLLWRGLPRGERRLVMATKGSRGAAIGIGAVMGLGALIATVLIVVAGSAVDPSVERRFARLEDQSVLTGSLWADALLFISLVALAPLGEEIVFRGLLLRGLTRRMPFIWAAILSSAVFAMSHLDAWVDLLWPRTIALAITGMVLAWAYRERGFLAAVSVHATVNAIAAVGILASA